jgi:hypothetical protein
VKLRDRKTCALVQTNVNEVVTRLYAPILVHSYIVTRSAFPFSLHHPLTTHNAAHFPRLHYHGDLCPAVFQAGGHYKGRGFPGLTRSNLPECRAVRVHYKDSVSQGSRWMSRGGGRLYPRRWGRVF